MNAFGESIAAALQLLTSLDPKLLQIVGLSLVGQRAPPA